MNYQWQKLSKNIYQTALLDERYSEEGTPPFCLGPPQPAVSSVR